MSEQTGDRRLGSISTEWTLLRQAHGSSPEEATAAKRLLWDRYGGAVKRYMRVMLTEEEAEGLTQEFALAFVAGGFKHADPARGRFRDYLKTSLFNLVKRHRARRARAAVELSQEAKEGLSDDRKMGQVFDEQ